MAYVQVNNPTQFFVDFNGAQGQLDAKVISPSGTEAEANVQQISTGKTPHLLIFYFSRATFLT